MKKVFQLFLVSIASFMLFSCSKQELLSKSSIEDLASKGKPITNYLPGTCPYDCHDTRCKAYANGYCGTPPTDTVAVKKNTNNPFDNAGLQHNNGVTYVMNMVNSASPTVTTDILHYTKLYGASIGLDTTGFDSWYNYSTAHGYFYLNDTVYDVIPNPLNTKLYNDGRISLKAKNYLNSINSTVDSTISANATPTTTAYNTVANKLITLENTIKNDNTLTTDEKNGLLRISAINRYTGSYWANYYIDNSGPQSRLFANFHWRNFWHADGLGAIGGACGGATGGWLGAAWGAVLGAVGGSAGYAILGD